MSTKANYKSLITAPLGLYGWSHLEPVILAALATELPMLLIGRHGCAKSFILERLAEALGLNFRCYNASLINYDDLVGIPMPSQDRKTLEYISNSTSIWDAQVVFIDELNRTRPELQNKLFPIIYDKRIQGQNLTCLRYRWAAMNPPCVEEDSEDDVQYLGAMPLDSALADRFPFIVSVPEWHSLGENDKKFLLRDQFAGRHDFPVDIHDLISRTHAQYMDLIRNIGNPTADYTLILMSLLESSFGYISSRRAAMLQQTLLAVHAARIILADYARDKPAQLEDSVYPALLNSLPMTAVKKPDYHQLAGICAQAWKLAALDNTPWRKILLMPDPVQRLVEAVKIRGQLDSSDLAECITSGIAAAQEPRKRALALAVYLAVRAIPRMPAAVVETLAMEIRPCFEVQDKNTLQQLKWAKIARAVSLLEKQKGKNREMLKYRSNLLNSFLPEGFADEAQAEDVAAYFADLWKEFGL